ncbi:hypothetical protein [Manganibacter manganicus]|uniref:Lipoprotein n=1 Tax=Manganibacter manganicus TaxID=1873176 RepID=A0A1V8RVK9_9HYPH|nr:hypothetical protein [Pseudaminobacter manganicus]OQM77212.1 hypothetical protein BFN67_10565 [Pseudaminobacter manganicus]
MRVPSAAISGAAVFGLSLLAGLACAHADDADGGKQKPIPFAGGEFTITQKEDYGEKTLAYDGKALASDYFVNYTGTVKVEGIDVAMFDVGSGGNACGPAVVMAWKPEGSGIESVSVGEDECGAPPVAINQDAIYFVPWLMPGGTAPVRKWSPIHGMTLAGNLTYMPDPGTGWKDIKQSYEYILDAFHNEAVYKAATQMLGDRLTEMTTSLLVGSGTEKTASGVVYGSGCVPHNCGGNDGFMAIDAKGEKLYFARQGDNGKADAWPALDTWPADLSKAVNKAFAPPQ